MLILYRCLILISTIAIYASIATKCLRALSDLFSPNLINQSSCNMDLVLAYVDRILLDDWSVRLGENRLDRVLKHLASMLCMLRF